MHLGGIYYLKTPKTQAFVFTIYVHFFLPYCLVLEDIPEFYAWDKLIVVVLCFKISAGLEFLLNFDLWTERAGRRNAVYRDKSTQW